MEWDLQEKPLSRTHFMIPVEERVISRWDAIMPAAMMVKAFWFWWSQHPSPRSFARAPCVAAANRDRLTQSIRSAHNNQTQFSISDIICYILPAGFVYIVYRILPTGAQNPTLVPITLIAIPVQANPSFKHNFLNENSNQNIIQGLYIAPPNRGISVKKHYIKTNVLHI